MDGGVVAVVDGGVVAVLSVMVSAPVSRWGRRPFPAACGDGRERPYPHQHLGVVPTVEMAIAVEPGFVCHGRAETSRHTAEQAPGGLVVRGDRGFEEAHAGADRPREDVVDQPLRESPATRDGCDGDLPEEPGRLCSGRDIAADPADDLVAPQGDRGCRREVRTLRL